MDRLNDLLDIILYVTIKHLNFISYCLYIIISLYVRNTYRPPVDLKARY
jgi:hypothetical protein